ncbi:MAG: hypothetical protein FWG57_06725 [Endomicrobia bacterium]|jgi:hypothetical protein|nr:hypothetical protein [Endomicrobiia bacterium]
MKNEKQLKHKFNDIQKKDINGFKDFNDFKEWYKQQYEKQEKKCHYCEMQETDIETIVMEGMLKSKRFPQNGKISQGHSRGVNLEIDRKKSNKNYSKENCVLACYFCNNDKSDVFDEEKYKDFVKDRKGFLEKLLFQSKKQHY